MKRCGDQQNLQKICNPRPAIVRLSLNSNPDNLFILGLLKATFSEYFHWKPFVFGILYTTDYGHPMKA